MPRAPAKIRKRYVEGATEVCRWDVEETLLFGVTPIFGLPCMFKTLDEWRREWSRWGDLILRKCIEHRPGTRPVAMYVLGEIPARTVAVKPPEPNGYWYADVRDRSGKVHRYWLNLPEPFMEGEAKHLRRLGIVDANELRRHREWMRTTAGSYYRYPLEMSTYD
jgi:hypothetical protein